MSYERISINVGVQRETPLLDPPAEVLRKALASIPSDLLKVTDIEATVGDLRFELRSDAHRTWEPRNLALRAGESVGSVLSTVADGEEVALRSAWDRLSRTDCSGEAIATVRGALRHQPTFGELPLDWYGRWVRRGAGSGAGARLIPFFSLRIWFGEQMRMVSWTFPCGGYPLLPVELSAFEAYPISASAAADVAAANAERLMPVVARMPPILGARPGQFWWSVENDRMGADAESFCAKWQERLESGQL